MQKVLFHIGTLPVYYFGLMLAVGLAVGVILALREAPRRGLDSAKLADFCLYSVLAGIVGARIVFVLFALDYYRAHPAEVLQLNAGGLSVYGGLLAGLGVAVWFTRRNRVSIWRLGDVVAPSIAIGEAIGRIGCDIYGKTTTWPLAIRIGDESYHNIPLYSTAAMGLLFAWLWWRRGRTEFWGQLFLEFVIGYSAARFFIEFARDSVLLAGPLSWAQVACLASIALAAGLWPVLRRKNE